MGEIGLQWGMPGANVRWLRGTHTHEGRLMLSSRARATSLAALLAVGGLGALATPAHAAEGRATIATGTDDVWVGD